MSSIATHVGIDVSKATLQVHIDRPKGRKSLKVSNDLDGINSLIGTLGEGSYVVSLEATGRYESLARRELEKAGMEVHLQNPRRMRKLAEGLGYDAKTDAIDAMALASTIGICKASTPRSELREELGDLSRTIEAIKKDRSDYKKRLQTAGFSEAAAEHVKKLVADMGETIKALEKDYDALIKKSVLKDAFKRCQTVPGVGKVTSRIVMAELAEDLSPFTNRQIASYGALCPCDNASGERVRKSKLKAHGNMHLKGAFYMPAVNQIGSAKWAKELYGKRRKQGCNHQQAIVPIMHRILLRVVAVLKRGSDWQSDPPKRA
jgi:transposase